MKISKREFLKRMGLGGAGLVASKTFGDIVTSTDGNLPPGLIGNPKNSEFAKYISPLPHTIEDGASASMKDGRVFLLGREVPIFHTTDVFVVGGGSAGFAAAIAAAKAGVKVALAEKDCSLGGLFTNGMVLIMLASSKREIDGSWTLVMRGVCGEFMDRARSVHFTTPKEIIKGIKSQKRCYHRNILIEDNGIETFGVPLLYALIAEDVAWRNNRVTKLDRYRSRGKPELIKVGCGGVKWRRVCVSRGHRLPADAPAARVSGASSGGGTAGSALRNGLN